MSTTPATTAAAGALAGLQNLKAGLQNVTQNVLSAGGDPILKLQTDGLWAFGQDNVEVQEGSLWAINPFSIRQGIVCWKVIPQNSRETRELYGKHLVGMSAPFPDRNQQAYDKDGNAVDHAKHPWNDVIGADLFCTNGDDKGEQVIYEPSSKGGISAMRDFINKQLIPHLDKDPSTPVALVKLESDSYNNKLTGGKTYFPILTVVDWISGDTVPAPKADEPEGEGETAQTQQQAEPEPKAAAAPRGRRAPAGAPAPEPQQEAAPAAPAGGERRRRRPAA